MEKFTADKITISELFTKKDLIYKIPINQREYSWEKEYIDNFWEYLTDIDDNYFLWTIVLNNEFLDKEKYKEIVDWQQRLLTITILLSIIRDIFIQLKEVWKSEQIHKNYISNVNDDNVDIWYKIVPWKSLSEYFRKNVQDKDSRIRESIPWTNEEKRVLTNYNILYSKVEKYIEDTSEERKSQKLSELREKIKNMELVYIEVSTPEDAFTFFETINATWMKLSTADVLKNLVFKDTSYSPVDIDKIWNWIIENLKNNDEQFDLTKFIRYFWLSKFGKVTDKKLYRAIKDSIKIDQKTKTKKYKSYDEFVSDLEYNSCLYWEILFPNENNFQWILKPFYAFLQNIKVLWVTQPYPAILALIRIIKSDNFPSVSTSKILELIKAIEHFTFVYKISWKSPSPLEWLFSEIAANFNDIDSKVKFEERIRKSKERINDMMPQKEEYLANLEKKVFYTKNKKDKEVLIYFFDKCYFWTNEIKFEHINIEHIYPQKPSSWESYDSIILHSIGNLTMLWPKFNRDASNKIPIDKVDYYKNSEINKTKELADYITQNWWGKDDIINRTNELKEKSWEIFKF